MASRETMAYVRSYRGGSSARFADPGLLADGKPRYPVASVDQTRAGYLHFVQNQGRYADVGHLAEVRNGLMGAMRRHDLDPYVEAGRRAFDNQEEEADVQVA